MVKIRGFISGIILLLIPIIGFSAQFTSVKDGNWSDAATWGEDTAIPSTGDDVTINGHKVSILFASVTVANITVINNASSSSSESYLRVNGNITLNITGNLTATASNIAQKVSIDVRSTSIVNVAGNLVMERTSDNTRVEKLVLRIYESGRLNVTGAFQYNYNNSAGLELNNEVKIYDTGYLHVQGASAFNQSGGAGFTGSIYGQGQAVFEESLSMNMSGGAVMFFTVDGLASLTVNKNLSLTNSGGSSDLYVKLTNGANATVAKMLNLSSSVSGAGAKIILNNNNSTFNQDSLITMNAVGDSDVGITMTDASNFRLGGDINRLSANGYGFISMASTSKFYFDGVAQQTVPKSEMTYAGTDAFNLTNTVFQNTSSDGLLFEGNFVTSGHMNLTDGIIRTSESAMLVLDDGASIDAGSSASYIDGPMVKRGSTGGSEFTFPVGDNGVFAPVTIEAISSSTLEYTAKYIGCPPPTLNLLNAPLKHVNNMGYWSVERSDNAAVGNISLHWTDADMVGITDTNALVISYLLPATGWHSLGKQSIQGNIGAGVSGSIKNDIGCPPPTLATTFALGSTDANVNTMPLPVEFISFIAYKNNNDSKVFLEWETAWEENSSHFVIEKSTDGGVFQEIDRVQSAQNSNTTQFYSGIDNRPSKGNNYYRIQQIDEDDIMSFTKLINVFIKEQDEKPTVYPNPVQDQLNVFNKALNQQEVFVKIIDLSGNCIYSNYHQNFDGQIHLSVSSLNIKKPGIYFINYYQDGGRFYSQRFMKL